MPGADSITSATGTVPRDPTCLHERACPISHSPCPGECAFALVMNSGSLGVLLFEAHQRRVVFANPEALRLVSLQGRPESYADFAELLGLDRALAIGPGQPPLQPEPLKLGGRVVGYSVYREDPFVWVFARDITDRARLETVAEAVESMNNIGYIFTTVRHEIGNPINSVKMALSVLRQNFDRFPRATALEYLERSLDELTRVEELLATLRSFSLFESARLREVDLGSFLADFARLVRPGLQGRGVRLEVELRDRPAGAARPAGPAPGPAQPGHQRRRRRSGPSRRRRPHPRGQPRPRAGPAGDRQRGRPDARAAGPALPTVRQHQAGGDGPGPGDRQEAGGLDEGRHRRGEPAGAGLHVHAGLPWRRP